MPWSVNIFEAPKSSVKEPHTLSLPTNHCFRAAIGSLSDINIVPNASPSDNLDKIWLTLPPAITVFAPERAASLAALSFVIMPPLPRVLEDPASSSRDSSWEFPLVTRFAFGFFLGSASKRPSWSVSITNRSASIILATNAAKVSLSPKRIWSVATVSFSLITGITPNLINSWSVFLTFK